MNRRIAAIQPSATLAVTARANALVAEGKDVVRFTAGEPDMPTPAHICAAAKEAIDAGKHKYTPTEGVPALRKAIADKLLREGKLAYKEDEVIATAGGKQAIMEALLALCEESDEVLIPSPYWVSYPEQTRLAGAKPVIVPTENGVARAALIKERLTPRSKVIIISSPSNPTGAVIPKEELKRIAALARENGLWVISDEVYEHLVFEGEHASVASFLHDRTIVIGSCSKTYAMTGWRIGWAAGPKEVIRAMATIQSHMTSGPSSIAQYAAIAALEGPQECVKELRDAFAKRRRLLCKLLDDAGLPYLEPHGAFYVFVDISKTGLTSGQFMETLLEERLVAVIPGKPFGSDSHVRLSYACSEDTIKKGMARIKAFMEGYA